MAANEPQAATGFPGLADQNAKPRSWGDATPLELLQAEVQSLREGLQHLKDCTMWALEIEQTAQRDGSPVRPEAVLDEEWSK